MVDEVIFTISLYSWKTLENWLLETCKVLEAGRHLSEMSC